MRHRHVDLHKDKDLTSPTALKCRLWSVVRITYFRELDDFFRHIECQPSILLHIKKFIVSPLWSWGCDYPYDWEIFGHDWEILGPPEDWHFADRLKKRKKDLRRYVVPKNEPRPEYWMQRNGFPQERHFDVDRFIYGWSKGHDGRGDHPLVQSASHFRKLLTPLIEEMKNLRTLDWGSQIVPLNATICRALSRAEHLQEVSLGPCGQFYTSG